MAAQQENEARVRSERRWEPVRMCRDRVRNVVKMPVGSTLRRGARKTAVLGLKAARFALNRAIGRLEKEKKSESPGGRRPGKIEVD